MKKICHGEFQKGQRLPSEIDLCDQYKVSRPVVRVALRQLRTEGFIESIKGLGSFVRCNNNDSPVIKIEPVEYLQDILDCYSFRIALEGKMAYEAALRCNANDLINIQRAFNETEKTGGVQSQHEMKIDLQFHMAIAEATHNRFYVQGLQAICLQILKGMSKLSQ